MRHPIAILLSCLLLTTGLWAADREKTSIPAPPPIPSAIQAELPRGGMLEIPLKAATSTDQPVDFVIRKEPVHGKLGTPKSTGRNAGVISYRHAGGFENEDFFLYAARLPGGAISAPVKVTIRITDAAPKLGVDVAELSFGKLFAAEQGVQTLEIRNDGGGVLSGQLEVTAPWEILPSGAYEIGAGEKAVYKLTFRSDAVRQHDGRVTFSHDPARSVALKADVIAPVEVTPSNVRTDSRTRPIPLEIRNLREQPVSLSFEAHEGLRLPGKLDLAGGERAVFEIWCPAEDARAWSGEIVLSDGTFRMNVPVVFGSLPGKLGGVKPEAIDLGTVISEAGTEVNVELRNTGGLALDATIGVSGGASLAGGEKKVTIPPMEAVSSKMLLKMGKPGTVQASLVVRASGDSVSIPLKGMAVAAGVPAVNPPAASASSTPPLSTGGRPLPTPRKTVSSPQTSRTSQPPAKATGIERKVIEPIRLVSRTQTSLVLEWPAKLDGARAGKLEKRNAALVGQNLELTWQPLPDGVRNGENFRLTLDDLSAGTFLTVRPVREKETPVEWAPQEFRTRPRVKRNIWPVVGWTLGTLTAAGLFAWSRIRAHRKARG